jgi:hypothetical protein
MKQQKTKTKTKNSSENTACTQSYYNPSFLSKIRTIAKNWHHICDNDECSGMLNICQFELNPHHETTTRARFNPKHIDERVRIVEETTRKIPQTVRRWNVSRSGCVRLDTGETFGRIGRGKASTIAILVIVIILDLLHQVILVGYIRGEESFCILEQKPEGVVVLG